MTSQYRGCLKMTLVRLQDRPDDELKSVVYEMLVKSPPANKIQSANTSLLETSAKGKNFICIVMVCVAQKTNDLLI